MCVVSVIVKGPVLPLCVVDGRSRNPLYYYYYNTNMNKQIIYGSTTDVQLIVLILDKQIMYGRPMDVIIIIINNSYKALFSN